MDAISSATAGLLSASRRFDASATRIAATAASGEIDPVDAIDQIASKTSFQSNAAVLKTADQMVGSLLDIRV